jgi:hypothetical protein
MLRRAAVGSPSYVPFALPSLLFGTNYPLLRNGEIRHFHNRKSIFFKQLGKWTVQ